MKNYLNFETDIKNLENELEKLKDPYNQEGLSEVDTKKISKSQEELNDKLKSIYSNLDPWQTTMVARHEDRPKSKFFIDNLFEDFISLSGDRYYGEDKSVIAGFAKLDGLSVLVIGQEKGDNLESRIERNFGMMRPEGYRKTIRLMELASKFGIPIISFIDTPGAYPGVGAEERGQAEAIARSIECCMKLKVPTFAIIIGEGGSGGAIALASSSKVIMLENAIYSVISPEGCATILWRDPKRMLDAAKAMKLSAKDLLEDYEGALFGGSMPTVKRPALIFVDFVRAYLDTSSPLYAGVEEVVQSAVRILEIARKNNIPVIFTNVEYHDGGRDGGVFYKKVKALKLFDEGSPMGAFLPELKPEISDKVFTKQYASAFFNTGLSEYLSDLN